MKLLVGMMFLLLLVSAYGQGPRFATATRARNGHLIGLSNILGLSDCTSTEFSGKVREIEVNGDKAQFELRSKKDAAKKRQTRAVEVDLVRIAPADRKSLFHDLIQNRRVLRVAGYICKPGDPISAFSIDLIY